MHPLASIDRLRRHFSHTRRQPRIWASSYDGRYDSAFMRPVISTQVTEPQGLTPIYVNVQRQRCPKTNHSGQRRKEKGKELARFRLA